MVAVDQGLAHLGRSVQSAAAEKGSYPLINYMDKRAPPFMLRSSSPNSHHNSLFRSGFVRLGPPSRKCNRETAATGRRVPR